MSDDMEHTSGSGSGLPKLVKRTVGRQLQLSRGVLIGRGRYGHVYRVPLYEDPVAAKVFFTLDEKSWVREAEIYQTCMLQHENILRYIAADIIGTGSQTQMVLITSYHERGSLYDYMKRRHLSVPQMLRMVDSIATGLTHLHVEINGTKGKPAIAHRDIKSKNILVKDEYTCVIGDFGLAVKHDSASGKVEMKENPRVGTKRYMAPELLNQTMNLRNFHSFKMADIYSFALVMWEMVNRTQIQDQILEYKVPYEGLVSADPSFEDMHSVVCKEGKRPHIQAYWNNDPYVHKIVSIIHEGWSGSAHARLSALRLKKSLHDLILQMDSSTRYANYVDPQTV